MASWLRAFVSAPLFLASVVPAPAAAQSALRPRRHGPSSVPVTASFTGLGQLPGQLDSTATAVSADGSVVVGFSESPGQEAFRWEDGAGKASWNPRCEINARYSMGWATGMGDRRPDIEDRGEA